MKLSRRGRTHTNLNGVILGSLIIGEMVFPIERVHLIEGKIRCDVSIPQHQWELVSDPFPYGVYDPAGRLCWCGQMNKLSFAGGTIGFDLTIVPNRRARSLQSFDIEENQ